MSKPLLPLAIALLALSTACAPDLPTGAIAAKSSISDAQGIRNLAAGDNNDWSACQAQSGICRVSGHVSGSTITGMDQAYYGPQDVGVWFLNDGSVPITVANASTSSSLDNRIHTRTGADVIVAPGYGFQVVTLLDWTQNPQVPMGWREFGLNAIDSVTHSTPTRALGTAFQPSTSRPVVGCYSVQIDTTINLSGGESGRVEILSDASNPPTTIRGSTPAGITGTAVLGLALATVGGGQLCVTARPNDFVLLRSVDVTGTPAYTITRQSEDLL